MALISIHQSFQFKTAHLIFKYFICFCIWRILSLPSQFINLAMTKTRFVFWHYYKFKFLIKILWTIRERTTIVCNMNQDIDVKKTSNHHDAGLDILRTALEGSVNQAAYQLQQNLGGGFETRPPRGRILTRGRGVGKVR